MSDKVNLSLWERWTTKPARSAWRVFRSLFTTTSLVRELRLPLTAVIGGSAFVSLLLFTGLAIAGVDLSLNLTSVGLLLGVLLPTGLEIRKRTARPRRVVIVDSRRHEYGHAVARGAERELYNDKHHWLVDKKLPPSTASTNNTNWQIETIQRAIVDDVDGMLLLPAANDERLWLTLASAIKGGCFVVVVDIKPSGGTFRDLGVEPPRFVSARYSKTGVIIGEHLDEWLNEDVDRTCILWIGPEGSWPGEERSRNVLYELARGGHLNRIKLNQLDSWTPNAQRCRETLEHVKQAPEKVAVYCADDENALALHLFTLKNDRELRDKMHIIGCNGTTDNQGDVQVLSMHAVEVTVDILAEQQGASAGRLFIRERSFKLPSSERSVYTPSKLLLRGYSKERWLDAVLDDRT